MIFQALFALKMKKMEKICLSARLVVGDSGVGENGRANDSGR